MSIILVLRCIDSVSFVISCSDESHTKVSQFLHDAYVRNKPCKVQNLRIKKVTTYFLHGPYRARNWNVSNLLPEYFQHQQNKEPAKQSYR